MQIRFESGVKLSVKGSSGHYAGGDGGVIFLNGKLKSNEGKTLNIDEVKKYLSVEGGRAIEDQGKHGRSGYVLSKWLATIVLL